MDQVTKFWPSPPSPTACVGRLLGDLLSLRLLYNPGAAFSIGTGLTWLFTIVAALAVAAVTRVARRVRGRVLGARPRPGAGRRHDHLLDRLFRQPRFARGHVVDFIDYAGFFVGNVADICLVFGGALVVLLYLRGVKHRRPSRPGLTRPPGRNLSACQAGACSVPGGA